MKAMAWIISILVFLVALIFLSHSESRKYSDPGSYLGPWEISLPLIIMIAICLVICFVIHFIKVDKKEKEKRERERLEREATIEHKRREAEALIARRTKSEQRVVWLVNNSTEISKILIDGVTAAKSALNSAEQNYKEGAFAPFWDDVEWAVTSLARFDYEVKQIAKNSADYKEEIQTLGSVPAVFDWDKAVDSPDAVATANRLQAIVRIAQKDFQFAVIYEQRKTNQLLSIGFANLAQALNEIGRRIDESTSTLSMSIADLSQVVSDTSAKELEARAQETQIIAKDSKALRDQLGSDAKARQAHEEKETEFLTDMQKAYRRVHRDELEHKI